MKKQNNNQVYKSNDEGVKSPSEFEFKGQIYKLVDFENEWTLEQQQKAKPLISSFFNSLNISDLKNMTDDDINGLIGLLSMQVPIDVLALIWLNKEDNGEFDNSTYENRIESFKKLKTKEYEIALQGFTSFFIIKVPSILNDFQIILGALQSLQMR